MGLFSVGSCFNYGKCFLYIWVSVVSLFNYQGPRPFGVLGGLVRGRSWFDRLRRSTFTPPERRGIRTLDADADVRFFLTTWRTATGLCTSWKADVGLLKNPGILILKGSQMPVCVLT